MTTRWRQLWPVAATMLVLGSLAFRLDGYPLLDPDEGRNAEVAREMAASNDYVLPRLNGLPYLDKPVLYFAAAATAMEALGPTVIAARLPSLLFTFATLALVIWFGARLYGREGGIAAGLATGTSPFTLAYARTVIFDSALTFFTVLALVGFYFAIRDEETKPGEPHAPPQGKMRPADWWRAVAWSAMALGILTKGPIALVLPLLVVVPYAWWRHAGRGLADPIAIFLFAALILPWIVAVSREIPDFVRYAVVTESALRLTTPELQRVESWWYFLPILPAAALPWSILLLSTAWRRQAIRPRTWDARTVFLLLWIVVPLAFFTLSQSKRPQYVLPLIPAFGLLVGGWWAGTLGHQRGLRAGALFLMACGTLLIAFRGMIPPAVSAAPEIALVIPRTAATLGGVCLLAGIATWFTAPRRVALLALGLPVLTIPSIGRQLMQAIGRERSAAPIAAALDAVVAPETEIVAVRAFPLSLPFYLRRTLVLATDDATELTSNYLRRHYQRWARAPGTPLRPLRWWVDALHSCERPRVFVVRSTDTAARALLDETLDLLLDTGRYAAYGPCGGSGGLASGRG